MTYIQELLERLHTAGRPWRPEQFRIWASVPPLPGETPSLMPHELGIWNMEEIPGRRVWTLIRWLYEFEEAVPASIWIGRAVHEAFEIRLPTARKEVPVSGDIAGIHIEGDVDYVVEYGERAYAIELKFASTPPRYPYYKHRLQVNVYRMLLRDAYERTFTPVIVYVSPGAPRCIVFEGERALLDDGEIEDSLRRVESVIRDPDILAVGEYVYRRLSLYANGDLSSTVSKLEPLRAFGEKLSGLLRRNDREGVRRLLMGLREAATRWFNERVKSTPNVVNSVDS